MGNKIVELTSDSDLLEAINKFVIKSKISAETPVSFAQKLLISSFSCVQEISTKEPLPSRKVFDVELFKSLISDQGSVSLSKDYQTFLILCTKPTKLNFSADYFLLILYPMLSHKEVDSGEEELKRLAIEYNLTTKQEEMVHKKCNDKSKEEQLFNLFVRILGTKDKYSFNEIDCLIIDMIIAHTNLIANILALSEESDITETLKKDLSKYANTTFSVSSIIAFYDSKAIQFKKNKNELKVSKEELRIFLDSNEFFYNCSSLRSQVNQFASSSQPCNEH